MELINIWIGGENHHYEDSFRNLFNDLRNVDACIPPFTDKTQKIDLINLFDIGSYSHFGSIIDQFGRTILINMHRGITCREVLTDFLIGNILYCRKTSKILKSIIRTKLDDILVNKNDDVCKFVKDFYPNALVKVEDGYCYFSYGPDSDNHTGILPSVICLMLRRYIGGDTMKFLSYLRENINEVVDYSRDTGVTSSNLLIAVIFYLRLIRLLSETIDGHYNGPHTFFIKNNKAMLKNCEWIEKFPITLTRILKIVGDSGNVYNQAKLIFKDI